MNLGSLMMVFFIPNQNRLALMKGREIGESELWFILSLLWLRIITCELKIYCVLTESIARVSVAAAAAKSLQSCPTLCSPIDGSPLGSPVPGILQARTLEWVAIFFSNAWKWKVKVKSPSHVRLFETPWTTAYQAPPSMGFSRQEYWSGVPLPSPSWKLLLSKLLF